MRINSTLKLTGTNYYTKQSMAEKRLSLVSPSDTFSFSHKTNKIEEPSYKLSKNGKHLHLVSFKALENPVVQKNPSIRAGLQNAKYYQQAIKRAESLEKGTPLILSIVDPTFTDPNSIKIKTQNNETLGNMPKSFAKILGPLIKEEPESFIVKKNQSIGEKTEAEGEAGTKNKANLLFDIEYTGKNKFEVQKQINEILYKNAISPEEVLHRILGYKKVLYGDEIGIQKISESIVAINNIVDTLQNHRYQKILLIGHNKPDGDTAGCCMGLKCALEHIGKEKVDIAIDDVLAGFLKKVIPEEQIKKSPEFMDRLNSGISTKINDISHQGDSLENAAKIYSLLKVKEYYNQLYTTLDPNEKYDLVVFLDVPGPGRVRPEIKKYVKDAKQVIYIDHHPFQAAAWEEEKKNGGIDIDKIKRQRLFWVEPKVPAATMLVGIIVNHLIPNLAPKYRDHLYGEEISQEEKARINHMVSNLVVGTLTDTSGFKRNMSRSAEDENVPSDKKIGFAPAGFSNWLLNLTNGELTRYSIKKQIKYEVPNKVDFYFPQDFLDFFNSETIETPEEVKIDISKMIESNSDLKYKRITEEAAKNTTVYKDIGLGISKIYFSSIKSFLDEYNLTNPEINMRDVIGVFKYNPTTVQLRYETDDEKHPVDERYKVDPQYKHNKISVMIREEALKGELDSSYQIADENSVSFSFRSQDGTNYAALLATLFGGGGHAPAAGATLSMPGITADSKLITKINGQEVSDPYEIYAATQNNYDAEYTNPTLTPVNIEFEISDKGKPIADIITDFVRVIRQK